MKNKVLACLCILSFLIASFLTVVEVKSFDRYFYDEVYTELETHKVIGISEEDLEKMTDVLLGYLKDDYQSLDVLVEIDGEMVQGFNQREIDHMVDVKILYENAMLVRNICLVLFVLIALYLYFTLKNEAFPLFVFGFYRVMVIIGAIVLALALFAWIDFDAFWTNFHLVFFDNDLWILNPRVDRLIMMVPSLFFSRLVYNIVLYTVESWFIFYVFILVLKGRFYD